MAGSTVALTGKYWQQEIAHQVPIVKAMRINIE